MHQNLLVNLDTLGPMANMTVGDRMPPSKMDPRDTLRAVGTAQPSMICQEIWTTMDLNGELRVSETALQSMLRSMKLMRMDERSPCRSTSHISPKRPLLPELLLQLLQAGVRSLMRTRSNTKIDSNTLEHLCISLSKIELWRVKAKSRLRVTVSMCLVKLPAMTSPKWV